MSPHQLSPFWEALMRTWHWALSVELPPSKSFAERIQGLRAELARAPSPAFSQTAATMLQLLEFRRDEAALHDVSEDARDCAEAPAVTMERLHVA